MRVSTKLGLWKDSGLDSGLEYGLDFGLDFGLDSIIYV